ARPGRVRDHDGAGPPGAPDRRPGCGLGPGGGATRRDRSGNYGNYGGRGLLPFPVSCVAVVVDRERPVELRASPRTETSRKGSRPDRTESVSAERRETVWEKGPPGEGDEAPPGGKINS